MREAGHSSGKLQDVEIKDEGDHGFGMAYANPGSWEQEGMGEFGRLLIFFVEMSTDHI